MLRWCCSCEVLYLYDWNDVECTPGQMVNGMVDGVGFATFFFVDSLIFHRGRRCARECGLLFVACWNMKSGWKHVPTVPKVMEHHKLHVLPLTLSCFLLIFFAAMALAAGGCDEHCHKWPHGH